MKYDFFISHASEDKDSVARPLARELERRGFRVWYDERELTVGDSLRRSIDRGLRDSRFGVVILSPKFLEKEWPNRELDGMLARGDDSGKIVLPVWHGVSREQIARYSPTLADKIAVSTNRGVEYVADEICRALKNGTIDVMVATSGLNEPLSEIRTVMLSAAGSRDLQRCAYEIEKYLSEHPHDVDAMILRDTVFQALSRERTWEAVPRASLPAAWERRPLLSGLFAALILCLAGVTLYKYIVPAIRPTPTELRANPAGDHYSIRAASRASMLEFVLTWQTRNDLDLAVRTPDASVISYERPLLQDGSSLDGDVRRGPGTETITMKRVTEGSYRVFVHNYDGARPVDYRLAVAINHEVKRIYIGTITTPNERYALDVTLQH